MLNRALAVAAHQGARYFALLAALDLAGVADHSDRKPVALEVLKRVYEGFSEGFSFPALVKARGVIEGQ